MFSLTGGKDVEAAAEGHSWSVTAAESYPAVTLHPPHPKKDMEMKVGFATESLLLLTSLMAETLESSGSHSYEKPSFI